MTPEIAERDAEIARLHALGKDTSAIAAEVGISARSVCRALLRVKAREKRESRPRAVLGERMTAMLADGASYVDVAETFDVDVKWLRAHAPGFGWDSKTSGAFARVLKRPECREMYRAIQQMPLVAA